MVHQVLKKPWNFGPLSVVLGIAVTFNNFLWFANVCSVRLETFRVDGSKCFIALPIVLCLCHVVLVHLLLASSPPISYRETLSLLRTVNEAVPSASAVILKAICKMHQVIFLCIANPSDMPTNHRILKLCIWCNYRINLLQINSTKQIKWVVKL